METNQVAAAGTTDDSVEAWLKRFLVGAAVYRIDYLGSRFDQADRPYWVSESMRSIRQFLDAVDQEVAPVPQLNSWLGSLDWRLFRSNAANRGFA